MNKAKEKREKIGLTQDEMAEKMRVSVRTIRNIENGSSPLAQILEYDRMLNIILVGLDVEKFNERIECASSSKLKIDVSKNLKYIYVISEYDYFDVDFNSTIGKYVLKTKASVINSYEKFIEESDELMKIINQLNK